MAQSAKMTRVKPNFFEIFFLIYLSIFFFVHLGLFACGKFFGFFSPDIDVFLADMGLFAYIRA